jgi:hypothetical protein
MDSAKLLENVVLCYLPLTKIQEWLKENNLWEKDFTETRKQWEEINSYKFTPPGTAEKQAADSESNSFLSKNFLLEKNHSISFFIDTELLMIEQDIVLLQVVDENAQEYLTKTYSLNKQEVCQSLWGENKHIILLTKKQWSMLKQVNSTQSLENQNCFILFKDEVIIKNKLVRWLETYK